MGPTAFENPKTARQLINSNKRLQNLGWRTVSVWWSTMTCFLACNIHLKGTRMCGRLAVWGQDIQDIVDQYKVAIGGEDICLLPHRLVLLFFSIY